MNYASDAPKEGRSDTRIRVEQHSAVGLLWFGGWLFTLGYLQLPFFWRGILAVVLWPYYLGVAFG